MRVSVGAGKGRGSHPRTRHIWLQWDTALRTQFSQGRSHEHASTQTHTHSTYTLLHYDLSTPPLTSHPPCCPPRKLPPPPQLQEIPNDLHHQCACCISCQERVRARTTNTHTKHINEQRLTHKPYAQTNKTADRRSDRHLNRLHTHQIQWQLSQYVHRGLEM